MRHSIFHRDWPRPKVCRDDRHDDEERPHRESWSPSFHKSAERIGFYPTCPKPRVVCGGTGRQGGRWDKNPVGRNHGAGGGYGFSTAVRSPRRILPLGECRGKQGGGPVFAVRQGVADADGNGRKGVPGGRGGGGAERPPTRCGERSSGRADNGGDAGTWVMTCPPAAPPWQAKSRPPGADLASDPCRASDPGSPANSADRPGRSAAAGRLGSAGRGTRAPPPA